MRRTPPGYLFRPRRPGLCCGAVASRLAGSRNKWAPSRGRAWPRPCVPAARAWRWPCLPAGVVPACRCRAVPGRPRTWPAPVPGRRPSPLAVAAGPVRWVILVTGPASPPIRGYSGTERHSGEKNAEKCWRRARQGLLTVPARIWAGSREGTRHGLSDQRIGDRPQRAHRGDGQHPVVSPRQVRGFLAWPGHARPAHHVLRCGDVNLARGRTWTAALRQQSGRRPAGRRTTLRVPRHGPAQRPGPGRPDPAGRGPAWIMPSARSAP